MHRSSLHCVPARDSRPPHAPHPSSGGRGQGTGRANRGWLERPVTHFLLRAPALPAKWQSPSCQQHPSAAASCRGNPRPAPPSPQLTERPWRNFISTTRPRSGHRRHPARRDASRKDQPAQGQRSARSHAPGLHPGSPTRRAQTAATARERGLRVSGAERSRAEPSRVEASTAEQGGACLSGAESGRVQTNGAEFSPAQMSPNEQSRA